MPFYRNGLPARRAGDQFDRRHRRGGQETKAQGLSAGVRAARRRDATGARDLSLVPVDARTIPATSGQPRELVGGVSGEPGAPGAVQRQRYGQALQGRDLPDARSELAGLLTGLAPLTARRSATCRRAVSGASHSLRAASSTSTPSPGSCSARIAPCSYRTGRRTTSPASSSGPNSSQPYVTGAPDVTPATDNP